MDHAIRDRSVCRIEKQLESVPFLPAGVSRTNRVRHGISGEEEQEIPRRFWKNFRTTTRRIVEPLVSTRLAESNSDQRALAMLLGIFIGSAMIIVHLVRKGRK